MAKIRRMLLVIPPSLERTVAVERAEALARALRAEIWIGLFDPGPRLGALGVLALDRSHQIERLMRDFVGKRLRNLRDEIADAGLIVHVIDDHERMSTAAVAERVERHAIDLVITDVAHEPVLRRLMFLPRDLDLLRTCPAPIWFVGPQGTGLPLRVVATVDPLNPEHGSGALNDAILDLAQTLGDASGGKVDVFTTFAGPSPALQKSDPAAITLNSSYEELHESLRKEHRRTLDALMRGHGLNPDDALIVHGPVANSLLRALDDHRADVVVVGVIRRHGLERLLMGSTVERLMGHMPCDLIAVPSVTHRAIAPIEHRGTAAING